MEGDESAKQQGLCPTFPVLLELSASDDLAGFRRAVEEEGCGVDESGFWYGPRIGSRKMGLEERTPLMIASMFGSKQVLNYILEMGRVDVNRGCGSDGATALHCAVAGDSASSLEVVKLLLDAHADVKSIDANGHRPVELINLVQNSYSNPRLKLLKLMLKGGIDISKTCIFTDQTAEHIEERHDPQMLVSRVSTDGSEKKEYPVDPSLPDIKNGIYGTDEFRMYMFKVKPCSRAYSHDWTECPFVHPGENAKRRDPRKYHYSCVPCPEFRKGTCQRGDSCEYAHGIFECWLHPAQYRTRLCKDETNCTRRVCFFAHKVEELRPLFASTGSAVPSPRSFSNSASTFDITSISSLALGCSSPLLAPSSTPMTPTGASLPMSGSMCLNPHNLALPTLQLPGNRLKAAHYAWDMDLDTELLGLDSRRRLQQRLMDEMSGLSSPSSWNNSSGVAMPFAASSGSHAGELNRLAGVKSTNLDDIFGPHDPKILPYLQDLSLDATNSLMQSPTGLHQNMNHHLRASYPSHLSSSLARPSSSFGVDSSGTAASFLSSRSFAFAKRSQSFIDRSAPNCQSGLYPPASPAALTIFSDWSSPDGKLDWGIQKDELNKLRKSASFGFRSRGSSSPSPATSVAISSTEPNVSWVQSNVNDVRQINQSHLGSEKEQHQQYPLISGGSEMVPPWVEQLYMEQEQLVA